MSNGFDIGVGEEFLRLISFVFVRLIIQFRDRPCTLYFYISPIFVSTILRFHTRFNCFYIHIPPALHRIIPHTRATILHFTSRFIYIERLHPALLISIPLPSPVTYVSCFTLISVDAIFIIPFFSSINSTFPFYHTHLSNILHIQRSSFCEILFTREEEDEFATISSNITIIVSNNKNSRSLTPSSFPLPSFSIEHLIRQKERM